MARSSQGTADSRPGKAPAVGDKAKRVERDASESSTDLAGNKFRSLFKKAEDAAVEEGEVSEAPLEGSQVQAEFDLSALHKRNERQKMIQANKSSVVLPETGRHSTLRGENTRAGRANPHRKLATPMGAATEELDDHLNTDEQASKRQPRPRMQRKLNPDFLK